jgi:GH25 family lysozyme M1 (1,4-beta-N-acetylmuramidase)
MANRKDIDVSKHNGAIDWEKVKQSRLAARFISNSLKLKR